MKRLLVLVVLLLSACNAQSASLSSAPPTLPPTAMPTSVVSAPTAVPHPTAAPSAAATDQSAQPTAATGTRDCGQITMLGPNPPRESTALDSENCFRQAFEQCSPASLTVAIRGVDAGTTHTFTTAKTASGCTVSDTTQSYVIPLRTPTPATVQCTGVTTQNGALVIKGCGGGEDIVIPAP